MGLNTKDGGYLFNDSPDCPIRDVVRHLGSRWAMMVMLTLSNGALRFTEVRKLIENISQRMLTQTLRQLECDGYIERKVFAEVPPRVTYQLTPLGQSAVAAFMPLVLWARDNHEAVKAARKLYQPD